MFFFFLFLIPILVTGVIILRKTSSINKVELLLPVGSILGLLIFTFLLNLIAFILPGPGGVIAAYLLVVILGFIIKKYFKSADKKISFPQGIRLFFWLAAIFVWGVFLLWKTGHALIGSDTNLYYAIAHTFIKGNFPFLTPWQPDIPLSYHTGVFELLGAFYVLTGLNFQFLHLFFSAFFILCAVQIVIWIIKRHASFASFLLANLAAAVSFISFGFLYITWPVFPVIMPKITSIQEFILWLRNLPTVREAIEAYGAPINLDMLIYFIFHAFGLAIFLSLISVLLNYKKEKAILSWLVIMIGLTVLAMVNESLFIAAFPALILGILLTEWKEKTLSKNLKILFIFVTVTLVVVIFEGGIITTSINRSVNMENSAVFLPTKEDVKEDFRSYHTGQVMSKLLPFKTEWLPLRWFHPGIDILMAFSLMLLFLITKNFTSSLLIKILFMAGFSSLVAYMVIVPKFLVANGNRFLSASFLFFSLLLCFSTLFLWEKIQNNKIKKTLFLICFGLIVVTTVLPPLALLSKNRYGESKLTPKHQQSSEGILWLKNNAKFSDRVIVLDKNAPHPSGQVRALVEAGVFAPVFSGDYRAFTIEASPEYMDIAYYLSPLALNKLKINILLLEDEFYETLPYKRKEQLENKKYFKKVFESSASINWEKIYKVEDEYIEGGGELDGTLARLFTVLPPGIKIYIDNEENFEPSFLRRPLIFTLKDKDIYYLTQSGVYLNVEADINSHPLLKDGSYDYLILGSGTDPQNICRCRTELIWKGIRDKVYIWKKV